MSLYRVSYRSMTAHYGPSFIEADSEQAARQKFAGTAFTGNERALIKATPVSVDEMKRALRRQIESEQE